jgi:hypothetical protein
MAHPSDRIIQLAHERGDILAGDDGFYIYWPSQSESRGALTEWDLRTIADELGRLNAPWQAQIDAHFASGMEAATAGETPKSGSTEGDSPP